MNRSPEMTDHARGRLTCASTFRKMTSSIDPTTGNPDVAPRAIVAGHGDFAAGLVSAVAQITGRGDTFIALSNRDRAPEDIERTIGEALDRTGAQVVFTDLPAGSCTFAARKLARSREDLAVVTGANLATLLDFVFQSGTPPLDAAMHAAEKGRAALQVIGGGGTGGR